MRGVIQRYNKEEKTGVIIAFKSDSKYDKTKYTFMRKDFKALGEPKSGMRVEFSMKGNTAINIDKDISASIGRLYKQNNINSFSILGFGKQLEALFENGMHNKFGFIASIAMIICLLLPLVDINIYLDARNNQNVQLVNMWYGKIAFVMLIASCIFFYGGMKRFYIKIFNGILSTFIAIGFTEIFVEIQNINKYAKSDILSTSIGFILGVVALVVFVYFTYIHEPYNFNSKIDY